MDQQQLAGLLGQGGITAALMWIIYKVGMALVGEIKGMRRDIQDHTKQDLAAQAEVREELVAMATRIDVIADITPIRAQKPRARTAPEGVPVGYYGPRKPPREDG